MAQDSEQLRTTDGASLPPGRLPAVEALRGRTVRDQDLVITQPNGHLVPVLVSSAPIWGPGGGVAGAVVTLKDISTIRKLERMREEWVSLIAHDLRQPVTVINGYAQMLQRLLTKHAPLEEAQRTVANILVSTHNVDRMVGDLLDASRIEQVLGNLLTNAAKYSYPDTEIAVEALDFDGEVQVSVTDHGEGIAPDELPKLFTRFYRTREARGKGLAGLGLGLYITKGIVEAQGGRIWAESIPCQSTIFRFTLPIPAIGFIPGTAIGLATVKAIREQHEGSIHASSQEGVGSTFTVRLPISPPAATSGDSAPTSTAE